MFKYIKEKSRGAKGAHSLRIARGRASDKLCTSPTMKVGSASGRPILPILALTAILCLAHCSSDDNDGGGGGGPSIKAIYLAASPDDEIRKANPDGSDVQSILTGLDYPNRVALDLDAGKLYWTESGMTDGIYRANLDGSNVETLVSSELNGPAGIAIDKSAGKLYWVDRESDTIKRANLNGSGPEDLLTFTSSSNPIEIALDTSAGKFYLTESTGMVTDGIYRANLDGSVVEKIFTGHPRGIALDIDAGKMYWAADLGSKKIRRANLDGSDVEDLVTTGLTTPVPIQLDLGAGKMYWGETSGDKIQRANLDGSDVETLVTGSDANGVSGIVLEIR